MRFLTRFGVILLLASGLPAAQMSKMYGQIFHQNGRPAANVTITVDDDAAHQAETNAAGVYSIRVAPGSHAVRIGSTVFKVHIFDKPRNRRDFRIP
jgi:hypothetical protein